MARFKDREKAIQLRQQGLSYSQIKEHLHLSKSTLSVWLRNYPLSRDRINELRARSEKRIERFRETMRRKREARLLEIYQHEKKELFPLSRRELYIAGLLLYAGEGSKTKTGTVSLSNTNPAVIKFFLYWLIRICKVPKEKVKIRLHLYRDMNPLSEQQYWMSELNLKKKQFKNPYIKSSSSDRINYHGGFGHGTCNVLIGNTALFEKILMGIKVIIDETLRARVRSSAVRATDL